MMDDFRKMARVAAPARSGDDEWRKGWPVVMAAALAAGIGTFHINSTGIVMKSLVADFGWTRTQVSAGPFLISLAGLFILPALGIVIDKVGARQIGLVSPWLFGLGLIFLGQAGPGLWSWYLAWGFLAIVSPAVTPLVWATPVVSRFDRHRGMALGVVIGSNAILATIVPIFMNWGMENIGRPAAFALLGVIAVAMAFPPVFFLFFDAEDLRRRGKGDSLPSPANAPNQISVSGGLSFAETLRASRFWRIMLIMVIAGGVSGFFLVHLVPLLTDARISTKTAALIASGISPAIVLARFATGWLLDRIRAPLLIASILLMPMVACVLVVNLPPSVGLGWTAAVLIGVSIGAEGDAIPFIVSRYFGRRSYGATYGMLIAAYVLGNGGGPLLGAATFDATGSYSLLLVGASAALILAAIVTLTLGAYPNFAGINRIEDSVHITE